MTQLTDDCRAAAARLEHFTNLAGNIAVIGQIADEDALLSQELLAELQGGATPPPDIMAGLERVARIQSTMRSQCGHVGLFPYAPVLAQQLLAAVDYVENPPEVPPVETVVGTIEAIAAMAEPSVIMAVTPLDARIEAAAEVLVKGTGWASVDDQWWSIEVLDPVLAMFKLLDVDTSAETDGAGGTISVMVGARRG